MNYFSFNLLAYQLSFHHAYTYSRYYYDWSGKRPYVIPFCWQPAPETNKNNQIYFLFLFRWCSWRINPTNCWLYIDVFPGLSNGQLLMFLPQQDLEILKNNKFGDVQRCFISGVKSRTRYQGCLPFTPKIRKDGKTNFVSPRGSFLGKPEFFNGRRKFPNGNSESNCAFHLLVFTSFRPIGLDRLWSYLPGKSLKITGIALQAQKVFETFGRRAGEPGYSKPD